MEEVSAQQMQEYMNTAIELVMSYAPMLILAIVVLFVGLWMIKRIVTLMNIGMERSDTEPTLTKFLTSLVSIGLKALLLISVASMVGIATTSFIALVGAAGLAVGLALQGSLQNFAGGVLVLMFKPFKVGDYIEAQGVGGTVAEIEIFNTIIKTSDNKVVIVPNGALSNGIITNYSRETTRRVDLVFSIGYDDDIGRAKDILNRLIEQDRRALTDPAHLVVVSELAESSVNITVRIWANASDSSNLRWDFLENVKLAFDREGISIPYPHREVHVHQSA